MFEECDDIRNVSIHSLNNVEWILIKDRGQYCSTLAGTVHCKAWVQYIYSILQKSKCLPQTNGRQNPGEEEGGGLRGLENM